MKLSEFIEEIHSDLSSYSDSGDIDDNKILFDVVACLRQLGKNIQDLEEVILRVRNSKATLPTYFKSLKCALKLNTLGCDWAEAKNHLKTDHYIYKEYIINPAYFDEVNQEYVKSCDSKIITETITIGNHPTKLYYDYEWLSVVKGVNRSILASDCFNFHPAIRNTYPHQINITGNIINTNFSQGDIYVQFYTLPKEDGELAIPELTTGDILQYIKQVVKVNIAENLIANNKNPQGLAQIYPTWKQELQWLKPAAMKEARFWGLSKDWNKKYKALNKLESSRFHIPTLNF